MMRKTVDGVVMTPLHLNYKDDGNTSLFVRSEKDLFVHTLYKIVITPEGYKTAPINSAADTYFAGVLTKVNSRKGVSEVYVGGPIECVIRQDLEPGYAWIEGGQLATRQDGPEYKMQNEFGYIHGPVEKTEDRYWITLFPFMVVENAVIGNTVTGKEIFEDNEDSGQ